MSLLLEKVKVNSRKNPSRIFYKNPYLSDNGKLEYVLLTWEDLHNYSNHLGGVLGTEFNNEEANCCNRA